MAELCKSWSLVDVVDDSRLVSCLIVALTNFNFILVDNGVDAETIPVNTYLLH